MRSLIIILLIFSSCKKEASKPEAKIYEKKVKDGPQVIKDEINPIKKEEVSDAKKKFFIIVD